MKICLYSSQRQALEIIEAPANMSAGRRFKVAPHLLQWTPAIESSNAVAAIQTPLAIAEIKALHFESGAASWIAVCIDQESDAAIEKMQQQGATLHLLP